MPKIDPVKLADDYLKQKIWLVRENANTTYSLQGLNFYLSAETVKLYWLYKIYPKKIRDAHLKGKFHLHNLSLFGTYCMGWDLEDLLLIGFKGVPGKITSKPAKHFSSALGQVVNFFYTLQGECYSEDTEILTENGWKKFNELEEWEKVFTLNENGEIELQKPVRYFEFDFNGHMYNFKSKKLDLLVTPNHNMIVYQYAPHIKEKYKKKFVKAEKFNKNTNFIPKNGKWKGKEEKYFTLPGIEIEVYRNFGKKYEKKKIKEKKIPMDLWLKFFGFWLAEGSTYKRRRVRKGRKKEYYGYLVRIVQNKGKISREFEDVLKKLPFNYYKKVKGKKIEFVIENKQLFNYLKKFSGAENKYLPKKIKNLHL